MKFEQHAICAIPLAVGYFGFTRSVFLTVLAVVISLSIDIDHVLDYFLIKKSLASLQKMMSAFETFEIIHKNYFLFHSWEWVILGGIGLMFNPHPWIVAIFVGFSFHVFCDQIYNTSFLGRFNLKHLFYFLIYRAYFHFDVLTLRQSGEIIKKDSKIY